MQERKRILIIEDHDLVVWAITRQVEKNVQDAEIYTARSFDDGLEKTDQLKPHLIILDIDIPGGNTPKMVTAIQAMLPAARILIYTGLSEDTNAMKYLTAGAHGFVSKNDPIQLLEDGIMTLLDNKNYVSPKMQAVIAERFLNGTLKPRRKGPELYLTEREQDVIMLLLKGKWTNQIADELGLKPTTVSTHKASIFSKFGVSNPVELISEVKKNMPELLRDSRIQP